MGFLLSVSSLFPGGSDYGFCDDYGRFLFLDLYRLLGFLFLNGCGNLYEYCGNFLLLEFLCSITVKPSFSELPLLDGLVIIGSAE